MAAFGHFCEGARLRAKGLSVSEREGIDEQVAHVPTEPNHVIDRPFCRGWGVVVAGDEWARGRKLMVVVEG